MRCSEAFLVSRVPECLGQLIRYWRCVGQISPQFQICGHGENRLKQKDSQAVLRQYAVPMQSCYQ
jgi:hypothetical protein